MTIALQYCNITVDDVDAALPFYTDGLGLEITNDVGAGTHRWVTVGSTTQDGLGIVLSVPHAGRSKADGDALQQLLVKGALPFLVFVTDDVDRMFAAVTATGAEVVQEPTDQQWGPRDCAFRDPAGNTVRITQATRAA